MIGTLDLTKPYTGFGGDFPRIFNRTVFFDVIKDGKLAALDDKAYDMTGPIDGKPIVLTVRPRWCRAGSARARAATVAAHAPPMTRR